MELVADEPSDRDGVALEEPPRVTGDRVEDRLHLGRRLAHGPKDLTRSGLLVQGLDEGAVLLPELVEEPGVLDSDDGLVGKGPEESDLLVAEWPDLKAANCDGADRTVLPQQRNADEGSSPFSPRDRGSLREFVHFGLKVDDVDESSLEHGAPVGGSRNEGKRAGLERAVMRDGPQDIAIKAIDYGVEGLAESSCALSDRGKHRLNVCR